MSSGDFISSKRLLPLISLAKHYAVRPSELIKLDDAYVSYCFDETCAYIDTRIATGEEPKYEIKAQGFSDFYRHIGGGG